MINDQVHASAVLFMSKEPSSDHGVGGWILWGKSQSLFFAGNGSRRALKRISDANSCEHVYTLSVLLNAVSGHINCV